MSSVTKVRIEEAAKKKVFILKILHKGRLAFVEQRISHTNGTPFS